MRSVTQGEKAALVKELREEGYTLNNLLKAIGLSRSTYYYGINKTDAVKERNAALSSEISAIFKKKKERYGVRRVHHELLNRGFHVNHKRVQRIMKQMWAKLPIISSIGISAPRSPCRNGQPTYRSLTFLGANATFLRSWICTQMRLFPTIFLFIPP